MHTFRFMSGFHKRETVNAQRCENKSNAAAERSRLAPDLLKDIARDVNTARLALIFDTRRNVNTITEDVVAVDNDVSDVDTDAKSNSRLSLKPMVGATNKSMTAMSGAWFRKRSSTPD
jgi:hypothetical protein